MERPTCREPNFDAIPSLLAAYPNWVLWRYERRGEKWTKVPFQVDGQCASHSDPSTWKELKWIWKAYDELKTNLVGLPMDGIGFVFDRKSGIVGVDLDHCVTWNGAEPVYDLWATRISELLRETYCELSPSRTGLHFYCEARVPLKISGIRNSKNGIEVYAESRFFTFTGEEVLDGEGKERQVAPYWPDEAGVPGNDGLAKIVNALIEMRAGDNPANPVDLQSEALPWSEIEPRLAEAFASKNGSKIEKLYAGDCSDYPDDSDDKVDRSAADLALARYLTYYAGQNHATLMAMMEGSALERGKWREKRGAETVLARTCRIALETDKGDKYEKPLIVRPKQVEVPAIIQTISSDTVRLTFTELGEKANEFRHRKDVRGFDSEWPNFSTIYRPRKRLTSVILAQSNAGKSTFVAAWAYHMAVAYGWRFGFLSFEARPRERMVAEMVRRHRQNPVYDFEDSSMSDDEFYSSLGEVGDYFTSVHLSWEDLTIDRAIEELDAEIQERGIDCAIIDPFSEFRPPAQLARMYNEFAEVGLRRFMRFGEERDIFTQVLLHPTKDGSQKRDLRLSDACGSKVFETAPDYGLVLTRKDDVLIIEAQKIREDKILGIKGGKTALKFDQPSGTFYEIPVPVRLVGPGSASEF